MTAGPGPVVVLFMGHETSPATQIAFRHLRDTAGPGLTVRWLLDISKAPDLPAEFRADIDTYDSRQFANWGFATFGPAMLPGHCHFPVLRYHQLHPHVEWLWFVEYDVAFTGRWRTLFQHFAGSRADLLTCHLRSRDEEPRWHWWHTLRAPEGAPYSEKAPLRAFLVVARYSARALQTLINLQGAGWRGHQEVLVPTLLSSEGLVVQDLNARLAPRSRNFYSSRSSRKGQLWRFGSVRFRPLRSGAGWRRNMLYHPVKPAHMQDYRGTRVEQITVVAVRSKAELKRFIRLPAQLFADDPNFVPALEMERRDALSPVKNPYFEHAEAQLFLAMRAGRDVGRISAQVDRLVSDPAVGHFGLIAAEDNPAVFSALFQAAESWLRERGKTRVLGPFNLSINEETGLLIRGVDTPPMIFMSHDPAYAATRIESLGYTKAKDLLAYLFEMSAGFPPRIRKLAERFGSTGVTLRQIDMSRFESEFTMVMEIFNDAWSQNWSFVPFTDAELKHMAKGLKPLLDPRLTAVVEHEGKAVAFGIMLPNLNEIIRDFNGRLLPFNWLRLLLRLKKGTKTGRVPLMGVRRSFSSGLAGGLAPFLIIDSLYKGAAEKGIRQVELSWILEDNRPMRRIIEELGGVAYKTYRVFGKTLA